MSSTPSTTAVADARIPAAHVHHGAAVVGQRQVTPGERRVPTHEVRLT